MDLKAQRFSYYDVAFALLWLATVLISGFTYWDEISSFRPNHACHITDVTTFFTQFVHPKYWFGLLAIALTTYGAAVLYKKCASQWPWLSDGRWLFLALSLGLVFLITLIGCN